MNVVPTLPSRLLRLARRWFGGHAATRVFEPLVADWQHEAAHAQAAHDRALINARWALAFATSSVLVVVRGAQPVTRHATRAATRVLIGVVVVGLLQGVFRALKGASTTAAAVIAVSGALSVLPALVTGVTRQRRFARSWRPLALATLLTLVAQAFVLSLGWPWMASALETPAETHWVWRPYLLLASVLPGALGIAAARGCSRRHAAPELFSLLSMYPMLAWSDLFSSYRASVPTMSAIVGLIYTVWAVNVIRQDVARRAQHRARVARNLRLAARPTGR